MIKYFISILFVLISISAFASDNVRVEVNDRDNKCIGLNCDLYNHNPNLNIEIEEAPDKIELYLNNTNSSDGGHTVLNGGDDVLAEVDFIIKNIIKKSKNLGPSCYSKYQFTHKELESLINQINIVVVNKGDKEEHVYIDTNNYVSNEIVVNGKKRTAANYLLTKTIYIDRSLWTNELDNKSGLIIHELFGLMGLEVTDGYNISHQFLADLTLNNCKSNKKIEEPKGYKFKRGCSQRDLSFSDFNTNQVDYDDLSHILGFYSKADKCLFFWNGKTNTRLKELDLEININFDKFILNDGTLYIKINSKKIISLANYLKEPSGPLIEKEHILESEINDFYKINSFIAYNIGHEINLLSSDFELYQQFNKASASRLRQVIPVTRQAMIHRTDGESFMFPEDGSYGPHLLISNDGSVDYLYVKQTEAGFTFNYNHLMQLPKEKLNFPYTLINNYLLADTNYNFHSLFGNISIPDQNKEIMSLVEGYSSYYGTGTFLKVNEVSYDPSDENMKQLVEAHGLEVLENYTDVSVVYQNSQTHHFYNNSVMKSSSKVVKSFFDFRLNKYIILTNANLLNDQSNISLLILEEEAIDGVVEIKKTTCRFYNSHCKKLAPN